jgi:hypothetical protein
MADLDKEKVIGLLNRILEQELAGSRPLYSLFFSCVRS